MTSSSIKATHQKSIATPNQFWLDAAKDVHWEQFPQTAYNQPPLGENSANWFAGGKINSCYNALDIHIKAGFGEQIAIAYESPVTNRSELINYNQLLDQVSHFAGALCARGLEKGDRVVIYMPMIPQAVVAMLACARIGVIHSVVFGGFAAKELAVRIDDATPKAIISASCGVEVNRIIDYKVLLDKALEQASHRPDMQIIYQRPEHSVLLNSPNDIDWQKFVLDAPESECVSLDATDPLYILYTSGTTGKPKGVIRDNGGHCVALKWSMKNIYNVKPGDVFWAASDIGWVVGHSYIVYGPLANGAITLMFEGVPNYPSASRCWDVVDKHKVNIFYTAPTAIRALMAAGNDFVTRTKRESLKLLGTVGEPINPEAWEWYYKTVGDSRCPIVDTWWQTETGGFMLTPFPGATDLKPGSATVPFFGVEPVILDADGKEMSGACEGNLAIKSSWPSQIRSVYGDHQRCITTYFSTYKGYYFTGDGARRDEDGYYWITGRVDDVLNVSGHRMGTAEVESALVLHEKVAEAAVVGCPHDIKGQGIYAYVTLMSGEEYVDELKKELIGLCVSEIGPIAKPDYIQWAPGLPKTRSGKIMRRILRKIAANEIDSLGDTSTLADPSVVDALIENRLIR